MNSVQDYEICIQINIKKHKKATPKLEAAF